MRQNANSNGHKAERKKALPGNVIGEIESDRRRRQSERALLTVREMAARLNVGVSTLNRMRVEGTGPPFVKLGRSVRYHPDDGDEWVASNIRRSTSEVSASAGGAQ